MNIQSKRILITGSTGGIGQELSAQLAKHRCRLILAGRDIESLQGFKQKLIDQDCEVALVTADLSDRRQCTALVAEASKHFGGIDILINLAGVQSFKSFEELSATEIDQQIDVNLRAPIYISQAMLQQMKERGSGQIINIGSTFGSIGFAYFSVYSATKFGLRGFSESLRRELGDCGISISYIAPRATKTEMNSKAVYEMAAKTGTSVDDVASVAKQIIETINNRKKNTYIGFPENLFARINAIFPELVDRALSKQNRIAGKYANLK